MGTFYLSGYHIDRILSLGEGDFSMSLDLGVSERSVHISADRVTMPDGQDIGMDILKRLGKRRSMNDCFMLDDNELKWLYIFEGNSVYKLYEPKLDWPTTLSINGSFMHTISTSTPLQEAKAKADALGAIRGNVLDTVFGLGYTAMRLESMGAKSISSYEVSSAVIELAKANPWSKGAFTKRIHLQEGDASAKIASIKESQFDLVLHDPPTLQSRGELYSLSFYKELFRVLSPGGRLYHFIGTKVQNPKHNYRRGIISRLRECGFTVSEAYRGVIADKPNS